MDFTEQVGFEKNLKVANIGVGVEEGHKKMEEFLFGRENRKMEKDPWGERVELEYCRPQTGFT